MNSSAHIINRLTTTILVISGLLCLGAIVLVFVDEDPIWFVIYLLFAALPVALYGLAMWILTGRFWQAEAAPTHTPPQDERKNESSFFVGVMLFGRLAFSFIAVWVGIALSCLALAWPFLCFGFALYWIFK